MKTFKIEVSFSGKVTVPDTLLADLRMAGSDDPKAHGGDPYLHSIHNQHANDDEFLQAALRNAIRNVVRNGIITDIGGLGVGVKIAPAVVNVSVPERVVTKINSIEQVGVERISVEPRVGEFTEEVVGNLPK